MTDAKVRKENHALRTVTAILMFFIAGAHYYSKATVEGVMVNDFIFDAGRFAIPILILTSGYFSYSSDGHVEARMGLKLRHILYLIVIYKLFYLLFSTILLLAGKVDAQYILMEFLVYSPSVEFDCYNGVTGLESTQPIWFIYALFAIYVLWWILYKLKIDYIWTLIIAIPIVIVSLILGEFLPIAGVRYIGDTYIFDIADILYPFILLPFFIMGYYMHKHSGWLDDRISNAAVWGLIALGTAMTFTEVYLVGDSSAIFMGSIVLAFSLFLGTFRVPEDRYRIGPLIYIGRNLTMWMYVFFGAACLIMRWALEPYADNYWLCEVAGPFLAVLLDLAMALAFHLLLVYVGRRMASAKRRPF